jgi:hypothetical protein
VATTYALIYGTPGKRCVAFLDANLPWWLNNTPAPPKQQPAAPQAPAAEAAVTLQPAEAKLA